MRSQRALGRPPRDRDRESGPHDGGAFAHPCNVITACDELTILEVLSNPMLCHAVPPQVGFDQEAKRAVAQQDGEACWTGTRFDQMCPRPTKGRTGAARPA